MKKKQITSLLAADNTFSQARRLVDSAANTVLMVIQCLSEAEFSEDELSGINACHKLLTNVATRLSLEQAKIFKE